MKMFAQDSSGAPVLKEIDELFCNKPDALNFLYHYVQYAHLVDDLVDEPKNIDIIRTCTTYATIIYSMDYWSKNKSVLYMVDRLAHNQYFDAVKWEHDSEEWRRRDARALNHCGYNMLFAVILLEFGEAKLNEISIKFREYSHIMHKDDPL